MQGCVERGRVERVDPNLGVDAIIFIRLLVAGRPLLGCAFVQGSRRNNSVFLCEPMFSKQ